VPHVRIESLSDAQVEHFLQVYSPHGVTLWRHLQGTPQLDLYRTPIYLKMLVNQADAAGHIPEGGQPCSPASCGRRCNGNGGRTIHASAG